MTLPPLPIPQDDWPSRWLVLPSWRVLHRVAEIEWEDGEMIVGEGVTVCGRRGRLRMPGVFSRIGLKRCTKCCRALGIPQGEGHPYNEGVYEDGDVPPRFP
jgi:hypothetical protein